MLRVAIFLALATSAFALPLSESPFNVGDITPHPDCHYNISAAPNFPSPNGTFEIFVDSITSSTPINTWTCSKWDGHFTQMANKVTKIDFQWKIVTTSATILLNCTGMNFADQRADFLTHCYLNTGYKLDMQLRVAALGHGYVFQTFCAGQAGSAHWSEFMAFFSPNKSGLSPSVRAMLIKKLVAAGWSRDLIQRVPTQNGC